MVPNPLRVVLLLPLMTAPLPWLATPLLAQESISDPVSEPEPASNPCPTPALERLTTYTVQPNDTLEAIAEAHRLLPATVVGFNPALQNNRTLRPGQTLQLPPFNGIRATVAAGQSWQQVAQTYRVRQDVLFEVNGCLATVPPEIFVPGLQWFPDIHAYSQGGGANEEEAVLVAYPLPQTATVTVNYGWQPHPTDDRLVFNTGIALETLTETPVLAVGAGTVAYADDDPVYGKLVVVNHAQGLQTRYANLSTIRVRAGQQVAASATVGTLSPGAEAGGDFLFFEVRLNSPTGWIAQDPQDYIPRIGRF